MKYRLSKLFAVQLFIALAFACAVFNFNAFSFSVFVVTLQYCISRLGGIKWNAFLLSLGFMVIIDVIVMGYPKMHLYNYVTGNIIYSYIQSNDFCWYDYILSAPYKIMELFLFIASLACFGIESCLYKSTGILDPYYTVICALSLILISISTLSFLYYARCVQGLQFTRAAPSTLGNDL